MDNFITWLKTGNRLSNFKSMRNDFCDLYYQMNSSDINVSKEVFFSNLDSELLQGIGIEKNTVGGKIVISYETKPYTTESNLKTLANLIGAKYGISEMKTYEYLTSLTKITKTSTMSNNQSLVNEFLNSINFSWNEAGAYDADLYGTGSDKTKFEAILVALYVYADNDTAMSTVNYDRSYLKDILEHTIDGYKNRKIQEYKDLVRYDASNLGGLDDDVRFMLDFGKIKTSNANIEMFKNLIWQIKRKMNSKSISKSVMYTVYSKPMGVGKTDYIGKIIYGLFPEMFNADGKLSQLLNVNDRKALVFGFWGVDLQELTPPTHAMNKDGSVNDEVMSELKTSITSEYWSGRTMFGSGNSKIYQSAVFTSSANKHIYNVIHDTNGMRRYWEFEWGITIGREVSKDEINSLLDVVLRIYRNIDENDNVGYYSSTNQHWNEILEVQQKYRHISVIENFFQENGITLYTDVNYHTKIISKQDLYDNVFRPWIMQEGKEWKLAGMVKAIQDHYDINPQPQRYNGKLMPCYHYNTITDEPIKGYYPPTEANTQDKAVYRAELGEGN